MAPPLCIPVDTFPLLKPSQILHKQSVFRFSQCLTHSTFVKNRNNNLSVTPRLSTRRKRFSVLARTASETEIDMVLNKNGIYTPKINKVVVLWDLDNKPPRGPPYPAAAALKKVAEKFGNVIEISAYANRHAFKHIPSWVMDSRRERKELDILERKGLTTPTQPYVCGVCGRKCKTNLDLKKHFKQLHERERQKKLNRMRSLKGKKRQRFKERFIVGNEKYNEEARRLVLPKNGYGLAGELNRAGVYVKTVQDKPQAADWALKRQIEHSMNRGVDWLVLVTDDSDFRAILGRARQANLGTVVIGDRDRALGGNADFWIPWISVENGEATENDFVPKRREREEDYYDEEDSGPLFTVTHFDGDEGRDLESVFDEFSGMTSEFSSVRISAFSEGEEEEEEEEDEDYLLSDSDDEEF